MFTIFIIGCGLFFISPVLFIILAVKKPQVLWSLVGVGLILLSQQLTLKNLTPVNNEVEVKVVTELEHHDYSTTFIGKINHQKFLVTLNKDERINYDSIVRINITECQPITNRFLNKSSFDQKKYYQSQKIFYQIKAKVISINQEPTLITKIKNARFNFINRGLKSQSIINALLFGEKDFSQEEVGVLSGSGIIHLFTISGMHVSLIYLAIKFICNIFRTKTIVKQIIICLSGFLYFFLAGGSIPVFRAVSTMLIKIFYDIKTIDILNFICATLLILNPFLIGNPSFLLSFGISYLILLIPKTKPIVFCQCLFLLPLLVTINISYRFNLLTPLVNLIVIPIISFIFLPLCFFVFITNIGDNLLYNLNNILMECLTFVNKLTLNLGSFDFIKLSILAIIIYRFIVNKKYLITSFLIIATSLINPHFASTQFSFIDVNQGDATLIQTKFKKETILIDTGNVDAKQELVNYLYAHQVNQIDYLFITHFDEDHMANLDTIINLFDTKNIITSDTVPSEYQYLPIVQITNPHTLNFADFVCYLIPPLQLYEEKNNNSLVIVIQFNNNKTMMLTGDIEQPREEELVNFLPPFKVNFLKAAHHGSKTSSTATFLDHFKPDFVLISAGKNNRYHHPNKEVVERFVQYQITYWLTAKQGELSFYV